MIKVNIIIEIEKIFYCLNEGCVVVFGLSEDLFNYFFFEKCNFELELSLSFIVDFIKRKYVIKIFYLENLNLKLCLIEDIEI